jgi:hypothetical protein
MALSSLDGVEEEEERRNGHWRAFIEDLAAPRATTG